MKITVTKIKKKLVEDYGWHNMNMKEHNWLVDELIKDTLKIIDNELKTHKGISIKNQNYEKSIVCKVGQAARPGVMHETKSGVTFIKLKEMLLSVSD